MIDPAVQYSPYERSKEVISKTPKRKKLVSGNFVECWLEHQKESSIKVSLYRSLSALPARIPYNLNSYYALVTDGELNYLFDNLQMPDSCEDAVDQLHSLKNQVLMLQHKKKKVSQKNGVNESDSASIPSETAETLAKPKRLERENPDQRCDVELFRLITKNFTLSSNCSAFDFLNNALINAIETADNTKVIFENTRTIVKLSLHKDNFEKLAEHEEDSVSQLWRELKLPEAILKAKKQTDKAYQVLIDRRESGQEEPTNVLKREPLVCHMLPFLISFYQKCVGKSETDKALPLSRDEQHKLYTFWTQFYPMEKGLYTARNPQSFYVSKTSFTSINQNDPKLQKDYERTLEVFRNFYLNLTICGARVRRDQTLTYQKQKSKQLSGKEAGIWTVVERIQINPAYNGYSTKTLAFPNLSLTVLYKLNSVDRGYIKITTENEGGWKFLTITCEIGETVSDKKEVPVLGESDFGYNTQHLRLFLDEPFTNRLFDYLAQNSADNRFFIVASQACERRKHILIDGSMELAPKKPNLEKTLFAAAGARYKKKNVRREKPRINPSQRKYQKKKGHTNAQKAENSKKKK